MPILNLFFNRKIVVTYVAETEQSDSGYPRKDKHRL